MTSKRRITFALLLALCFTLTLGVIILVSRSSGGRQLLRAGARLKYQEGGPWSVSHPVIQRWLMQTRLTPDSMLAMVDISRRQVTLQDLRILERADGLEVLVLCRSGLTDQLAANVPLLRELREIDLSHTLITDRAVDTMARQPHLVEVDLSFTQLTDVGIERLLGVRRISRLGVSGCRLNGSCFANANLSTLYSLDISKTDCNASIVRHLSRCKTLTVLNVSDTAIGFDELRDIVTWPSLQYVIASGLVLSEDERAVLRDSAKQHHKGRCDLMFD